MTNHQDCDNRTSHTAPLPLLCHRVRHMTGQEIPFILKKLQSNLLMAPANVQSKGEKRIKELKTCIDIIEVSLAEYCELCGDGNDK